MRARKMQTEIRKEQILQATLELISSQGIQSLNINKIAKKVGIVPSAFYRHFKNKDAVLSSVLDLIENKISSNIYNVKKKTHNELEQLKLLFNLQTQMAEESLAIPHVLFSDGVYANNPEHKDKTSEILNMLLGEIQSIITSGQKNSLIRKDINNLTVAIMFIGMIMPAAIFANILGGNLDMKTHSDNAWPLFERSVSLQSK